MSPATVSVCGPFEPDLPRQITGHPGRIRSLLQVSHCQWAAFFFFTVLAKCFVQGGTVDLFKVQLEIIPQDKNLCMLTVSTFVAYLCQVKLMKCFILEHKMNVWVVFFFLLLLEIIVFFKHDFPEFSLKLCYGNTLPFFVLETNNFPTCRDSVKVVNPGEILYKHF